MTYYCVQCDWEGEDVIDGLDHERETDYEHFTYPEVDLDVEV